MPVYILYSIGAVLVLTFDIIKPSININTSNIILYMLVIIIILIIIAIVVAIVVVVIIIIS